MAAANNDLSTIDIAPVEVTQGRNRGWALERFAMKKQYDTSVGMTKQFSPPDLPVDTREEQVELCKWYDSTMTDMLAQWPAPAVDGVETTLYKAENEDGLACDVTIIRPTDPEGPLPGFVYLHGGGMAFLTGKEPMLQISSKYRALRGSVCMIVHFTNSMEEAYPRGLNDCVEAIEWFHSQPERFNLLRNAGVMLNGESGGGNLVIASSMRLKGTGIVSCVYANAPYLHPMGHMENTPIEFAQSSWNYGNIDQNHKVYPEPVVKMFCELYTAEMDPYAWPYFATDEHIQGLPPMLIVNNECDALEACGLDFFRRCLKNGVEVYGHTISGTMHCGHSYDQNLYAMYGDMMWEFGNKYCVSHPEVAEEIGDEPVIEEAPAEEPVIEEDPEFVEEVAEQRKQGFAGKILPSNIPISQLGFGSAPETDTREAWVELVQTEEQELLKKFGAWEFPPLTGVTVDRMEVNELLACPITVIRPENKEEPTVGMICLHGGGMALFKGDEQFNLSRYATYAQECGATVFVVHFRNSTEAPFPGPLDDCVSAIRFIHGQREDFGLIPDAGVCLCGESGGSNLALGSILTLIEEDEQNLIACANLSCPWLHPGPSFEELPEEQMEAYRLFKNDLDVEIQSGFAKLYSSDRDSRAWPAFASDEQIAKFPPVYFNLNELDALTPVAETFFRRLDQAGVATYSSVHLGTAHGGQFVEPFWAMVQQKMEFRFASTFCVAPKPDENGEGPGVEST